MGEEKPTAGFLSGDGYLGLSAERVGEALLEDVVGGV